MKWLVGSIVTGATALAFCFAVCGALGLYALSEIIEHIRGRA